MIEFFLWFCGAASLPPKERGQAGLRSQYQASIGLFWVWRWRARCVRLSEAASPDMVRQAHHKRAGLQSLSLNGLCWRGVGERAVLVCKRLLRGYRPSQTHASEGDPEV
jgi:hypothetical protein